jgi:hypothetical protein
MYEIQYVKRATPLNSVHNCGPLPTNRVLESYARYLRGGVPLSISDDLYDISYL